MNIVLKKIHNFLDTKVCNKKLIAITIKKSENYGYDFDGEIYLTYSIKNQTNHVVYNVICNINLALNFL